jgi:hypothetical protein
MKVKRQNNNNQYQIGSPSFNIGMGDIPDQFLKNLRKILNLIYVSNIIYS